MIEIVLGVGQSADGTLKLTVSEEWTDWIKANQNFFGGMVKNGCGSLLMGFRIDCISEMNRWNKLIFCMLVQIQESYNLIK